MPRIKLKRVLLTITGSFVVLVLLIQIEVFFLDNVLSISTNGPWKPSLSTSDSNKQLGDQSKDGDETTPDPYYWASRSWFFKNGIKRPQKSNIEDRPMLQFSSYKNETNANVDPNVDRIANQLNYVPPNYNNNTKIKNIFLYSDLHGWGNPPLGQKMFTEINKCPVNACSLVAGRERNILSHDAILFRHYITRHRNKPKNQKWILYLLESPQNTPGYKTLNPNVINWIASYRHDSDIVTPYEKFQPYDKDDPKRMAAELFNANHNWAMNKTKKVAWFVSNCSPMYRLSYARELSKYIDVDIYGLCGNKQCQRGRSNNCFDMLSKDYKFYLAFENSHCQDYVTEKFFLNGLKNKILPIVTGGRKEDYKRQAPTKSYIHVEDFESPKDLAVYLHTLNDNDELYNEYFQWKGTGEFINTYFWCRLCAMMHAPEEHVPTTSYENVENWWRGNSACIRKLYFTNTYIY